VRIGETGAYKAFKKLSPSRGDDHIQTISEDILRGVKEH
jgi:hypothetical protein